MSIEVADAAGEVAVVDVVATALVEVSTKNAKLTELVERAREWHAKYKDVAFDVSTGKGMAEAKAARAALRDEARYPAQELQKDGSKMLGTMQRQFNERAKSLIAEMEGFEKPVNDQIVAQETLKENERIERQRKEDARRAGHINAIAAIASMVTEAAGFDSSELVLQLEAAGKIVVDSGYEEFEGQARQALDETLRQLNGMLVAARADEADRAELEQQRQQQQAFRIQQEARQRDLDAQAATQAAAQADQQRQIDAQRDQQAARQRELDEQAAQQKRAREERADAVGRRIDYFDEAVNQVSDLTIGAVETLLVSMAAMTITADLFDDRVEEAVNLRDEALVRLESVRSNKAARAEKARKDARAAEVQGRIDLLADAPTTSAGLTSSELLARREKLKNVQITSEDYDDRCVEAQAVRNASEDWLFLTAVNVAEKERQAAEDRRQQEEQAAAFEADRAFVQRMRDASARLYDVLHEMVMAFQGNYIASTEGESNDREDAALTMAKALLTEINPKETFE